MLNFSIFFQPGRIAIVNKTFNEHRNSKPKNSEIVPRGEYRSLIKLWDNIDPNAYRLSWNYEMKSELLK